MYKNFKLSDEERISIREQHSKAVKKEFNKTNLNEVEGELNNPYWLKIKNALMAKGYKYEEYESKGSLMGYIMTGSSLKNQQHGMLKKGNISVSYPGQEMEGSEIRKDQIRVMHSNSDFDQKNHLLIMKKYGNLLDKMSHAGTYWFYVKYVNEFLSLVNDLEKL